MNTQKLLFVINPKSGDNGNLDLQSKIEEFFSDDELIFYLTSGDDDIQEIMKLLDQKDPDRIVAAGGDGTIQLVANCILGKKILMGIIPTGSANGLATELGIPVDPEAAIRLVKSDHCQDLDVLLINKKWISLHLSDLGFNARLVRYFEKSGQRGKFGYARHFIKTLFTQKPVKYDFQTDTESFSVKAQMVAFANARMYGTRAVVNPDGLLDDRKFEICIFKPYPWYALLGITARFFIGGLKQSPYVKIISVDNVKVHCHRAELLQIDGEDMGEMKEVSVSLHPDQLSILTPNRIT